MADCQQRAPTDRWEQSVRIDNGCSSLQPGGPRGPTLGPSAGHASEWDPRVLWRRGDAVWDAYQLGYQHAPAAIARHTGMDDLGKLLDGVLQGILQMLIVLAAGTVLGGVAGGVVGAVFGLGVGAVPAAAAGAELGFNVGVALITWMGLGMLIVEMGRGLAEVGATVGKAVSLAWDAPDAADRNKQVEDAGRLFGDAVGRLMLLILMAIVARLTLGQTGGVGARVAGSSDELIAALRGSPLKGGFADWVAANADKLVRNPKLRRHHEVGGTAVKAEVVTPSQLRARTEQSPKSAAPAPAAPSAAVAKGRFPTDPADMSKTLGTQPSKISTTKDGTRRIIWEPNANTRIRLESHPEGLKLGDPGFNPRHHGEHYHVEIKPEGLSWNQAGKQGLITKVKPEDYSPGIGTGFLPGEAFPGL